MSAQSTYKIIIQAIDRTSPVLKGISGGLLNMRTALAGLVGTAGLTYVAKGFVDVASSYEQMKVKLDALTKGDGQKTLDKLEKWALDMPVSTSGAVNSFVMMQAMGLEPTIEKLGTLSDVASQFGNDAMPRVARALGQMATLGKLSSEELNQLSEVGINARKYLSNAFNMTVEEIQKSGMDIRKVIKAIWDGLDEDFGGSALKMMDSWQGITTVLESYWESFRKRVMDAGVFDWLKDKLISVRDQIAAMVQSGEMDALAKKISDGVISLGEKLWGFAKETGIALSELYQSGKMEEWASGFLDALSRLATALMKVGEVAAPVVANLLDFASSFPNLTAGMLGLVFAGGPMVTLLELFIKIRTVSSAITFTKLSAGITKLGIAAKGAGAALTGAGGLIVGLAGLGAVAGAVYIGSLIDDIIRFEKVASSAAKVTRDNFTKALGYLKEFASFKPPEDITGLNFKSLKELQNNLNLSMKFWETNTQYLKRLRDDAQATGDMSIKQLAEMNKVIQRSAKQYSDLKRSADEVATAIDGISDAEKKRQTESEAADAKQKALLQEQKKAMEELGVESDKTYTDMAKKAVKQYEDIAKAGFASKEEQARVIQALAKELEKIRDKAPKLYEEIRKTIPARLRTKVELEMDNGSKEKVQRSIDELEPHVGKFEVDGKDWKGEYEKILKDLEEGRPVAPKFKVDDKDIKPEFDRITGELSQDPIVLKAEVDGKDIKDQVDTISKELEDSDPADVPVKVNLDATEAEQKKKDLAEPIESELGISVNDKAARDAIDFLTKDREMTITANFETSGGTSFSGSMDVDGYAEGGTVFRRHPSPYITEGSWQRDDVPIIAKGGEYIITDSAVRKYGKTLFDMLNAGALSMDMMPHFSRGGMVWPSSALDYVPRFASGGSVSTLTSDALARIEAVAAEVLEEVEARIGLDQLKATPQDSLDKIKSTVSSSVRALASGGDISDVDVELTNLKTVLQQEYQAKIDAAKSSGNEEIAYIWESMILTLEALIDELKETLEDLYTSVQSTMEDAQSDYNDQMSDLQTDKNDLLTKSGSSASGATSSSVTGASYDGGTWIGMTYYPGMTRDEALAVQANEALAQSLSVYSGASFIDSGGIYSPGSYTTHAINKKNWADNVGKIKIDSGTNISSSYDDDEDSSSNSVLSYIQELIAVRREQEKVQEDFEDAVAEAEKETTREMKRSGNSTLRDYRSEKLDAEHDIRSTHQDILATIREYEIALARETAELNRTYSSVTISGFSQWLARGGLVQPLRFATGGIVPASAGIPGQDSVPSLLSPDEGVLSTRAMRALGPEVFNMLNNADPVGALSFALGGLVPDGDRTAMLGDGGGASHHHVTFKWDDGTQTTVRTDSEHVSRTLLRKFRQQQRGMARKG